MKNSTRLCALGLAVVLGAGVQARAASPVLNIPPAAAQSGLREPDRKLIDDYVQYWVTALVAATDPNGVVDARKRSTATTVRPASSLGARPWGVK